MIFYLSGKSDSGLRLKSYDGTARGERMTINIKVETVDSYEFAWALQALAAVLKGQQAKLKLTPKAKPPASPAPGGEA